MWANVGKGALALACFIVAVTVKSKTSGIRYDMQCQRRADDVKATLQRNKDNQEKGNE